MNRLDEFFRESVTTADYAERVLQRMAAIVGALDAGVIAEVVRLIETTSAAGGTIYAAANGGSAAVASHFVNDLGVNAIVSGSRNFHVVSLADNVESITAVANDSGYENVFLYQLQCALRPGDLVIVMSVSGNSPNILRAVEYAQSSGARVVGMCGFDGGQLANVADVVVHVPTTADEYGPVEDAFSVVCHIVSGYLTMSRGRLLSH